MKTDVNLLNLNSANSFRDPFPPTYDAITVFASLVTGGSSGAYQTSGGQRVKIELNPKY